MFKRRKGKVLQQELNDDDEYKNQLQQLRLQNLRGVENVPAGSPPPSSSPTNTPSSANNSSTNPPTSTAEYATVTTSFRSRDQQPVITTPTAIGTAPPVPSSSRPHNRPDQPQISRFVEQSVVYDTSGGVYDNTPGQQQVVYDSVPAVGNLAARNQNSNQLSYIDAADDEDDDDYVNPLPMSSVNNTTANSGLSNDMYSIVNKNKGPDINKGPHPPRRPGGAPPISSNQVQHKVSSVPSSKNVYSQIQKPKKQTPIPTSIIAPLAPILGTHSVMDHHIYNTANTPSSSLSTPSSSLSTLPSSSSTRVTPPPRTNTGYENFPPPDFSGNSDEIEKGSVLEWLKCSLDRSEAQLAIKNSGMAHGSYLVRKSSNGTFGLSICANHNIFHMKIMSDLDSSLATVWFVQGDKHDNRVFHNIWDLLVHYKQPTQRLKWHLTRCISTKFMTPEK